MGQGRLGSDDMVLPSRLTMDADALTLFLGSFFAVEFLPARLVGLDRSPFDFGMPAQ